MCAKYRDLQAYPLAKLPRSKLPVALDTETLGETRETNIPIYFSYDSDDLISGAGPTTTTKGDQFLTALAECETRPKIFHNAKFDIWVLNKIDIEVKGEIEDTILMHCLLDEHHLGHHKLKILSRELLKRPRLDELVLKQEQRKVQFNNELPQQVLHDYAKPDAEDTMALYRLFKPQLIAQNLWSCYRLTVAAELVYLKMYLRGVALDLVSLDKALTAIDNALAILDEKVYEALGERFKISSPKQLGNVLAKHFTLHVRTITGWSTDKDALEPFRSDSKMQVVLAWKFLTKARQYLRGYKKRAKNGRLYSNYRQTTVTGRSASSDPNLENIPKQRGRVSEVEVGNVELADLCSEAFRQVRAAIIPSPGALLLAKDYKQVEYRCFAYYSQSERLINALASGVDFHTFVCKQVFGEETPQLRYITKILSFGLLYGMGKPLLITRIKMYHEHPYDVLDLYERLFPEMRETQKRMKMIGAQKGYIMDPWGRRYRFQYDRPHAIVAWVCQGTGTGSLKKAAMVKVDPILEGRRSGMVFEVHDELVFEIFPEDADLTLDIHHAMEDFHQLGRIPIIADTAIGPNFLDLKDVTAEEGVKMLKQNLN